MNVFKKYLVTVALVMASCSPAAALAESASDNKGGGGGLSAAARLNLQVIIPQFLYFQVGRVGGSPDTITFTPTDAEVGDGNPINGSGGDAGSGASVAVRSNGGQITITASNDGGTNGLGDSGAISLSEITADSSDNANLATPTLSDTGTTTSTPALNGGNVTDRIATWTYVYNNNTIPDAGTYTALITYTATSP